MLLTKIILLLLGTAALLYFYSSLRIRELAIDAARKRCADIGVQFLDQSVSASGTRLRRNAAQHGSHWIIERHYRFEFASTGEERYRGLVTMRGNRLAGIELEPHRLPGDE